MLVVDDAKEELEMWVGTSPRGHELARRANEAEARALARKRFLARVHFVLYCVNAGQLTLAFVVGGFGWFALLGPLIAAFGPRYARIGELIVGRSVLAVVLVWLILARLMHWW